MARRSKRSKTKSRRRRHDRPAVDRLDPLQDVVEYGGQLIFAVGFTSGGVPFGPRVEIVDGELRFPDEEPLDRDAIRFVEPSQSNYRYRLPDERPF
jgi:hypothetical protein